MPIYLETVKYITYANTKYTGIILELLLGLLMQYIFILVEMSLYTKTQREGEGVVLNNLYRNG